MTMWVTVLLACALAYVLKLAGHLVPDAWVSGARTSRITTLLPVTLLAALIVVQTVGGPGGTLTLDARLGAIAVAGLLLARRANFLVVVFGAAAVAALLRAFGWG